jgi:hypothetical protein
MIEYGEKFDPKKLTDRYVAEHIIELHEYYSRLNAFQQLFIENQWFFMGRDKTEKKKGAFSVGVNDAVDPAFVHLVKTHIIDMAAPVANFMEAHYRSHCLKPDAEFSRRKNYFRVDEKSPKFLSLTDEEDDLDNAIIYFDEVDKFFKGNGNYDDRMLEELLLFLDDNNTITYPDSFRQDCRYNQIPAKKITCILGGMFETLKEAAQKRLSLNAPGFTSAAHEDISDNQIYEYVNKEDLKKVIGSDELYGRIGHFVRVNDLSAKQLADILLQARESPLDLYRNYFSHHNIHLTITEDGAEEIANAAYKQQVGVRGLKTILWQVLEDEMRDIEGMRIIRLNRKYVQKKLQDGKSGI